MLSFLARRIVLRTPQLALLAVPRSNASVFAFRTVTRTFLTAPVVAYPAAKTTKSATSARKTTAKTTAKKPAKKPAKSTKKATRKPAAKKAIRTRPVKKKETKPKSAILSFCSLRPPLLAT